MKEIVSDTSPILFLAKLGKLSFLSDYAVHVPPQVVTEIKEGGDKGHSDYIIIERMLEEIKFKVVEAPLLPALPANLGEGESAAISLAVRKKIKFILIDEARGRKVARLYGLEPRGTLGILMDMYRRQKLTKQESRELIFELVKLGYRISEEVLVELLKEVS